MASHGYIRTRGVRWVRNAGEPGGGHFEMWCPDCASQGKASFWPLDAVHWDVWTTLSRCRACNADKKRRDETNRRATKRDALNAANRAYYAENRELLRWKDNQRKEQRRAKATALLAATPPSHAVHPNRDADD